MLGISICYSSYAFHLISPKRYEDIGYYSGIQAVTFLGNRESLKNFMALLNFTMGVMGAMKVLKCAIS